MSKLSKLRKRVRRLKRENLNLIIEANAARVRAGEATEALESIYWVGNGGHVYRLTGETWDKLDG